ncbi:hypothetical protein N0V83_009266 [Neocucurbitaria cava]|uniref:Uncharacterized protein n=1 Tax=Neocucurbitaria cava TaxID=798079 RepID=A0A9W8Y1J5_9PLEO|nr:hypothetical protein N0V83_009266 [Neocucurbitaria cava]
MQLYRTIDLSPHSAELQCEPNGVMYHPVPPDFLQRKWTRLDYDVFLKQKTFVQTLEKTPSLGKNVRELRWTVLDLSDLDEEECEDLGVVFEGKRGGSGGAWTDDYAYWIEESESDEDDDDWDSMHATVGGEYPCSSICVVGL